MDGYLESHFYCCFKCKNIVAVHDDIEKKTFVAGNRRAFLFRRAKNVLEGPQGDRRLLTGIHKVADIFCSDCSELLGWRYIQAYNNQNKLKEGKTVLIYSKIAKAFQPPFHT